MPQDSPLAPSLLTRPTARAVLAASPDAFVAVDSDGRITAWNPAAERTFGWSRPDVLGIAAEEVLLPDRHRAAFREGFERHRRTGESRAVGRVLALRLLHRDGHELPVEMTIGAADEGDRVVLFAFLRDVTVRVAQAEEASWTAEVVRTNRDAIVTVDVEGTIRSANPAFTSTYGYPAELVVGQRLDGATAGARATSGRVIVEHVREGAALDDLVLPYDHPDGSGRELAITLTPIRDLRGKLRGGALQVRDVTERQREERRLSDQLERLQSLSHAPSAPPPGPVAGASADPAAPVTHLLQAAREHLGLEVAWLSSVQGTQLHFDAVEGDTSVLGGATAGDAMPLEEAYCSLMLDGRIDNVVPDTGSDPLTAELPPTVGGVSAYAGVPVVLADGTVHGTFCVAGTSSQPALRPGDERFLHVLARLAAATIDLGLADADTRRTREELDAVHALLAALDARDHYTGEHSRSVVDLAVGVARGLDLDTSTVSVTEQVALLHDIGKVGIPDTILQKPGPLDDAEWALMREHPAIGERIVAGIPSLAHLAPAVRAEHERWDGGGYPDGLTGQAIPLPSRIALVCDAWHAMRSDRPYRRALRHDEAVAELRRCAGTQFDPSVVEALEAIVDDGH